MTKAVSNSLKQAPIVYTLPERAQKPQQVFQRAHSSDSKLESKNRSLRCWEYLTWPFIKIYRVVSSILSKVFASSKVIENEVAATPQPNPVKESKESRAALPGFISQNTHPIVFAHKKPQPTPTYLAQDFLRDVPSSKKPIFEELVQGFSQASQKTAGWLADASLSLPSLPRVNLQPLQEAVTGAVERGVETIQRHLPISAERKQELFALGAKHQGSMPNLTTIAGFKDQLTSAVTKGIARVVDGPHAYYYRLGADCAMGKAVRPDLTTLNRVERLAFREGLLFVMGLQNLQIDKEAFEEDRANVILQRAFHSGQYLSKYVACLSNQLGIYSVSLKEERFDPVEFKQKVTEGLTLDCLGVLDSVLAQHNAQAHYEEAVRFRKLAARVQSDAPAWEEFFLQVGRTGAKPLPAAYEAILAKNPGALGQYIKGIQGNVIPVDFVDLKLQASAPPALDNYFYTQGVHRALGNNLDAIPFDLRNQKHFIRGMFFAYGLHQPSFEEAKQAVDIKFSDNENTRAYENSFRAGKHFALPQWGNATWEAEISQFIADGVIALACDPLQVLNQPELLLQPADRQLGLDRLKAMFTGERKHFYRMGVDHALNIAPVNAADIGKLTPSQRASFITGQYFIKGLLQPITREQEPSDPIQQKAFRLGAALAPDVTWSADPRTGRARHPTIHDKKMPLTTEKFLAIQEGFAAGLLTGETDPFGLIGALFNKYSEFIAPWHEAADFFTSQQHPEKLEDFFFKLGQNPANLLRDENGCYIFPAAYLSALILSNSRAATPFIRALTKGFLQSGQLILTDFPFTIVGPMQAVIDAFARDLTAAAIPNVDHALGIAPVNEADIEKLTTSQRASFITGQYFIKGLLQPITREQEPSDPIQQKAFRLGAAIAPDVTWSADPRTGRACHPTIHDKKMPLTTEKFLAIQEGFAAGLLSGETDPFGLIDALLNKYPEVVAPWHEAADFFTSQQHLERLEDFFLRLGQNPANLLRDENGCYIFPPAYLSALGLDSDNLNRQFIRALTTGFLLNGTLTLTDFPNHVRGSIGTNIGFFNQNQNTATTHNAAQAYTAALNADNEQIELVCDNKAPTTPLGKCLQNLTHQNLFRKNSEGKYLPLNADAHVVLQRIAFDLGVLNKPIELLQRLILVEDLTALSIEYQKGANLRVGLSAEFILKDSNKYQILGLNIRREVNACAQDNTTAEAMLTALRQSSTFMEAIVKKLPCGRKDIKALLLREQIIKTLESGLPVEKDHLRSQLFELLLLDGTFAEDALLQKAFTEKGYYSIFATIAYENSIITILRNTEDKIELHRMIKCYDFFYKSPTFMKVVAREFPSDATNIWAVLVQGRIAESLSANPDLLTIAKIRQLGRYGVLSLLEADHPIRQYIEIHDAARIAYCEGIAEGKYLGFKIAEDHFDQFYQESNIAAGTITDAAVQARLEPFKQFFEMAFGSSLVIRPTVQMQLGTDRVWDYIFDNVNDHEVGELFDYCSYFTIENFPQLTLRIVARWTLREAYRNVDTVENLDRISDPCTWLTKNPRFKGVYKAKEIAAEMYTYCEQWAAQHPDAAQEQLEEIYDRLIAETLPIEALLRAGS